ncbi:MAG: hypothetical protein ACF8Q5_14405 [Phycisphaerales bacterium JB040]
MSPPAFRGELTLTRDENIALRVQGRGGRVLVHARTARDLRALSGLFDSLRATLPGFDFDRDTDRAPWWPPATITLAGRPIAEVERGVRPTLSARLARALTGAPVTKARPLALLRALLAR